MMQNISSGERAGAPAKIWWLWIPLAFLLVQCVLEVSYDARTLAIMHSEGGPHESAQFLILLVALGAALAALARVPVRAYPWLAGWLGFAALCCLYVAGEEVSWGQHIIGWNTPEFWATLNDQGETNLHNTTS